MTVLCFNYPSYSDVASLRGIAICPAANSQFGKLREQSHALSISVTSPRLLINANRML